MDASLWVSVVALLWSGSWIMTTLLLFLHQGYITDQPLVLYCSLLKNGLSVRACVWTLGLCPCQAFLKLLEHTPEQQSSSGHPLHLTPICEKCGDDYWAGSKVTTVDWLSWQQWRGLFIGGLTVLESLVSLRLIGGGLQSMLGAVLLALKNSLLQLHLSFGCVWYAHVIV